MNMGLKSIRKPKIRPMMLITNVKMYSPFPAVRRMRCKWASLEMQWAINQMGNSTVSTMIPALGYTSSMIPDITLRMPEIRAITGPKPV